MQPFDFSQRHYFFELERRHQITSSLSIPVGVLVILIGAITFLASNFQFDASVLSFAFGIFLLDSMIASIITIIQLFRSYWSYEYQYLSSPIDYKKYYDHLVSYHRRNSKRNVESLAKKDFENALSQNYSEAASINWHNNNQKSAILHKANTSLVWVVVFVFFSFSSFYIRHNIQNQPNNKQNEVSMSTSQNSNKDKQDQKPASGNKEEKPQPPQNVNLREGDEGKTNSNQKLND